MLEKNRGRQKKFSYYKKSIYDRCQKPKYSHNKYYNVYSRKRNTNLKELDDDFTYNKVLNSTFSNEIKKEEIEEENNKNTNLNKSNEFSESNKENCSSYSNNIISTFPNTNNSNLVEEREENQNKKKENEIKEFNSSSISESDNEESKLITPNCLNLSNEEMKEAFYFPKKLANVYKTYLLNQQFQLNKINLLSSFSQNNCCLNRVNSLNNDNVNKTLIRRNSDNLNSCINNVVINSKVNSNLNLFNVNVSPFSPYDINIPFYTRQNSSIELTRNINNTFIGNSFFENNENFKEKENTDILSINVKVSENESLVFKIRRYDDMFKTVKIFCEINHLDIKFIRPFILYIIKALNGIYGLYNLTLNDEEIEFLKEFREKEKNENLNKSNHSIYN